MEPTSRRRFTYMLAAAAAGGVGWRLLRRSDTAPGVLGDIGMGGAAVTTDELASVERGNFAAIFADPVLRERFATFLTNVFHLYPEAALQALIARAVTDSKDDREAYERVAAGLSEIAPPLSTFRYALPALRKQQRVLADQTVQLLGGKTRVAGYLEIGSDGRYFSALKSRLEITGPVVTSSPKAPGYGPDELVDRGQLAPVGKHIDMRGYQPFAASDLPHGSLELVTIYIGLHHVPLTLREPYVASIRDAMAKGGALILRDHDVTTPEQRHLVALAHDVFNCGTAQPWAVNEHELRHFYPLEYIVGFLEQHGFVAKPGRLLQAGDPTLNTLLAFEKA